MGFFDQLNKSKGGYIFLSHSHDDIEKVRQIRNSLEQDGFEPLCFYLKCLNDDSEIEDLIKREIDAREWFVFVNSENARKSKWVTMERAYITSQTDKKIITIDLDDEQSVNEAIHKIRHNLRVFISHSAKDAALADRIREKLEDKDYLVFTSLDRLPGDAGYAATIVNAVTEASQEGCVMILLTPNSVNNDHMLNELDLAYSKKGAIIPVLVGDVQLTAELRYYLNRYHFYTLPEDVKNYQIEDMIDRIGRTITR